MPINWEPNPDLDFDADQQSNWPRDYQHRREDNGIASVMYFYAGCVIIFGTVCGVAWLCKWLAK